MPLAAERSVRRTEERRKEVVPMRLALRVLLTSVFVAIAAGILVSSAVYLSLATLGGGGVHYLATLPDLSLLAVAFGVPLGIGGGLIALATVRRRNKALPRARWAARGVLVGLCVGALGSALLPLLVGSADGAAFVALPGGLAGALTGGVTGALLSRALKPSDGLQHANG
jgi:hypothetical protein